MGETDTGHFEIEFQFELVVECSSTIHLPHNQNAAPNTALHTSLKTGSLRTTVTLETTRLHLRC